MTKIEEVFSGVMSVSGDVWVADYTESTKKLPKELRKGVVVVVQSDLSDHLPLVAVFAMNF